MQRFAALLLRELTQRQVKARLFQPEVRFGHVPSGGGLGKWAGYIDKFIAFPQTMRRRLQTAPGPRLVHICDHSNAPYVPLFSDVPHLVTCNDLLAIRAARGEFPQHPTRWTGRCLQRYILRGLRKARRVACISRSTLDDFQRICPENAERASVIYMGLNYPYAPRPASECAAFLEKRKIPRPFILHVGGTQWYKNRRGTLEIYSRVVRLLSQAPNLVLAGKPLEPFLCQFISEARLQEKVFSVPSCGNDELAALYSSAELLLFPSWTEGFGWPIVEAMASGCLVVTTGRPPMTEAGGNAAIYLQPEALDESAAILANALRLTKAEKDRRLEAGFSQAANFSPERMVESYLDLYLQVEA